MILSGFWGRNERSLGLTIIELLIVMMIMATLASLGAPLYANTLNNARITKAVADIRVLEKEILVFQLFNGRFPNNLVEVQRANLLDPYGNPYQYLSIADAGKGKGDFRKDKNLVPINSDFDLYSTGRDGQSVPPLTAKQSWDDVIRAANGGFVGLASEF
ncbi:MAG: prepilin-type cleavage/methylation domain-containing protein [Candidatus Methylomirabilales bacterium]